MTAPTVLFDLDGTLLSTSADLLASLNHVLALSGLPPVAARDVNFRFGQGARAMISHGYHLAGQTIEPERLAELTRIFVDHYADAMPGQTVPFPGLIAALDRLEAAGMRLAVCTNKFENLARRLLQGLDLSHRFVAIAGGDSFAERKPQPGHLIKTIERAGGDAARAVMIGDSISDILGARNAGIPSIAVTFGYSDKPVHLLEPDVVIDRYDQLDAVLIERLLSRRV